MQHRGWGGGRRNHELEEIGEVFLSLKLSSMDFCLEDLSWGLLGMSWFPFWF